MSWIFYSLIMYFFSVIQYLMTRKMQKEGVDNRINTFMFLSPAIPLAFMFAQLANIPLKISLPNISLIALAVYFFSYLGIAFSLNGMKYAPNSGYSLVIQKSYAIYTAIAAILFFDAELTFQGALIILVIVLFSTIIMIPKNKGKKGRSNVWVKHSLLSFFLFGNLALFSKYIQTQGVHPIALSFYIFLFFGLYSGLALYKERDNIKMNLPLNNWINLILIGLCAGIFNISMQLAYSVAPNVGYVNIINSASITAITFLSTYFFKDKLSLDKVIGAIGVLCGLILLITLE